MSLILILYLKDKIIKQLTPKENSNSSEKNIYINKNNLNIFLK